MLNHELIEKLQKLPLDAEIVKDVSSGGCCECNPEGIPYCLDPDPKYHWTKPYPYHRDDSSVIIL